MLWIILHTQFLQAGIKKTPMNGHEKHKPTEVRRSKAFLLNKQLWFRVTRQRSVVPDASKSYLHLHIPGGYKTYFLKRAEFNLSLLQDR